MKVFEVITEHQDEVNTTRMYVTSEQNTLKSVTDYFTQHCFDYEQELMGVREVLTIVQHIRASDEEGTSRETNAEGSGEQSEGHERLVSEDPSPIFAQSRTLHQMLCAGWVIEPTSCVCGGRYAWLKPTPSGAKEMYGCVCHNTKRAMREFIASR